MSRPSNPDRNGGRIRIVLPVNPANLLPTIIPTDSAEAFEAYKRLRNLYGTMLLHRDSDLFVADHPRGRSLQDLIRDRLLAERFDADDADEWALRHWRYHLLSPEDAYDDRHDPRLCDLVVQSALRYRETGVPIDEAVAWTTRSIGADYAMVIRRRGWHPESFGSLVGLCIEAGTDDEDAWIESAIPAWRALRYLRAGMRLTEAEEQEDRRLAGDNVDPAIDLLIALRSDPW